MGGGLVRKRPHDSSSVCPQVWHDEGDGERVVLICDMWHPDVEVTRHVEPMLNAEQMVDMKLARRGEHRLLVERGYSTGVRVKIQ